MKLWGQEAGKVARATVAAGSGDAPTYYGQLSKKCRRLLDLACLRGRVERKSGDGHFDSLVEWGLLTDDGKPTEKGRDWHDRRPIDTQTGKPQGGATRR